MVSQDGKNLVFIFCLPRSGSTLLSLLLDGHERICCPPEPWYLLKLLTFRRQVNPFCLYDDNLALVGSNEFIDAPTFASSAAAFAATAYNARLHETGKEIFVDKTPRYYHVIDEIDRVFPRAKKIFLKRNPLDVALSYKSTWNVSPEMLTGSSLFNTLDFALGLYRLNDYFSEASADKHVVKYEDLVASPEENLRKICDFIGVEYDQGMLDFSRNKKSGHSGSSMGDKKIHETSAIHASSKNSGINKFNDAELQKLISFLGVDIFDKLGYSDVINPLKERKIVFPEERHALLLRSKYINKKSKYDEMCNLSTKDMDDIYSFKKSFFAKIFRIYNNLKS